MILVHLLANYWGEYLRVPFNAVVCGEIVCAALIVVAGGLRAEASPDNRSAKDDKEADWE
jgi:hypothetical protein